MTSFEIGTDIVSIERLRSAIEKHKVTFIQRIFTEAERELAKELKDPTAYYAGRFAAKEAISKALGTGFCDKLSWKDIEILREPSGKPKVALSKKAQSNFDVQSVKISISHEREFATAFAMIELKRER